MADLTAIILTKNEEENLPLCLESIAGFAKRAVVVDSGSADRTAEIARAHGAEVFTHEFTYYAAQFNWGIDNAGIDTEWILRLDADERFPKELCAACEKLMAAHASDDVNGIAMESEYYFLGKPIRHGITKKRKIMLFRRGHGRIEDRKRDAHTILFDGREVETPLRFLHYDCKDLTEYVKKYNWYAIRELSDYIAHKEEGAAEAVHTDGKLMRTRRNKFGVYYRSPKFFRAWLWFLYNYIFRLGFLDGRAGFLYHWFECYWYRFLVDAKIYEYETTGIKPGELKAL